MTTLLGPDPNLARQLGAGAHSRRQSHASQDAGIAIALGGGFSRGFAHLGVLEVLERERIPISIIVGTSIGGLLGAAYADGISVRGLCELGRHVRIHDFFGFQSSASEVDKDTERNDLIGRFVRKWFQASQVEELSIPTAIVTTDLRTGAPHVFTRGPLEVAVRASCAFPGLFKPVEYEGHLLADGCIVTPTPTAVAARMNAGCVLGVAAGWREGSAPSGRNVVHVFDRAFRASRRSMQQPSWIRNADILLKPEVHAIDWNDFSRVDEARAAGAEAMRRALPFVRQLLDQQSQLRRLAGPFGRLEGGLVS